MNILGMGPMELLLIVVLALIVFGPAKLPEIMAQVGKAINDFRRATSELSDEFNRTIQAELKETRAVVDDTRSVVTEAHTSVPSALSLSAPTRTAAPAAAQGSLASPVSSETASPVVPEVPSAKTAHTTSAAEPATSDSSVAAGES